MIKCESPWLKRFPYLADILALALVVCEFFSSSSFSLVSFHFRCFRNVFIQFGYITYAYQPINSGITIPWRLFCQLLLYICVRYYEISGKLICFYWFVCAAVFNVESYMGQFFLYDRIQNTVTTRCVYSSINNLRNRKLNKHKHTHSSHTVVKRRGAQPRRKKK